MVLSLGNVSANFDQFLQNVNDTGLNTQSILNAPSISRFNTARILNIIQCQDCINPSQEMITEYDPEFWRIFRTLPGKDFDDINHGEAIFQGESYYYCVAYAGDQEYMRGYPQGISPICE
jgi:hypothetical protein